MGAQHWLAFQGYPLGQQLQLVSYSMGTGKVGFSEMSGELSRTGLALILPTYSWRRVGPSLG